MLVVPVPPVPPVPPIPPVPPVPPIPPVLPVLPVFPVRPLNNKPSLQKRRAWEYCTHRWRPSAGSLRCLRALRVQGFLRKLTTIFHKHKKDHPFRIGHRSKATSPLYRKGVWGIGNTKGGGYYW